MSNHRHLSGLQAILSKGGRYGLYAFVGSYGLVDRFDCRGQGP